MDNVKVENKTQSIPKVVLVFREYSQKKIQENIECEIFQTILEEARESYSTDIVHECQSNTPAEMETNLDNIQIWLQQWDNS